MQWLLFIVVAFGPGLTPDRAEAIALLNLGIKQVQRHAWETALESVKKATEADPTFGRAHLTLGQIHREQGQHDAAADALRAGLKVAGDDAKLRGKLSYQLGATHLQRAELEDTTTAARRKQLEAAANAFGKATEANPQDYRAFHRLGRAYDELDMPKEADQAYRNCIEIQPRYDKCFVDLGIMYIDYGHENAAMQILETGVKVNDKSSTMWGGLGRAYAHVDRHQEAVDALKKAKAIDPNNAMVRFSLGMAYAELNDRKMGVEELQAFLNYAGSDVGQVYKTSANNAIARLQDVF